MEPIVDTCESKVYSCLMLPVAVDLQSADTIFFCFLYDVTSQSNDLLNYCQKKHPFILRCKTFNKYTMFGYTSDICWLGLSESQWEHFCSNKGKIDTSIIAQYDQLYTNDLMAPLMEGVLKDRKKKEKLELRLKINIFKQPTWI